MQSVLRIAILLVVTYSEHAPPAAEAPSHADIKWQPPAILVPALPAQPTIFGEMITRIHISKTPVILDETKMAEVQTRLGGSLGRRVDDGDSLAWLCYYGAGQDGRWALWLESNQTSDGRINGFTAQRLDPDARMDQRCGNLRTGEIDLPGALKLGMTETRVRESLGKPALKFRSTLVFYQERAEAFHKEAHNDAPTASNTVYVVLRRGLVCMIHVANGTTPQAFRSRS